ncbi:hypothetical protein FACS1894122_07620 [Alphaproteobacteria bacterium]|nr:hypothetical protein FACS1894122_07620 [Alphaproteobacteria bacterium]
MNADIIAFNNMTFQTYNTNNNLLLLVGGGGGALPAGNSREVLSLYNGAIPPGIVRSPVIQAQNANLAFGAGVAAASQMLLRKAQSGIIVTLNNPINQAALLGGLAANVVTVFWRLH